MTSLTHTIKTWTNTVHAIITEHKVKSLACGITSGLLLRYIYAKLAAKYHRLPPGPIGLPFLGCLLSASKIQTFCNHVSMTYGPIAYFTMGLEQFIVIGHSKLSKQLLEHPALQDRPLFHSPGRPDSFQSFLQMRYNHKCLKRRKYAQSIFVASCTLVHINKILSDTLATDIIPNLNECCASNTKWCPTSDLKYLTWNIVFHLNFGRSILRTDPFYTKVDDIEKQKDRFNVFKLIAYTALPMIQTLYPSFFEYERQVLEAETDLYRQILHKRKREIDMDADDYSPETYCDYLLKAQSDGEMSEDAALADLFLMYLAGSDTTARTIYWGLVLIAKYGSAQERVRDELLKVFGAQEFDLKKLNKLPIFRSFIMEILRISSVLPRGVPRKVWKKNGVEVECNGKMYHIPEGTVILNNTLFIHNNVMQERWKKVEFNLDQWLVYDKVLDKYKLRNNASFTGFGFGRRECIGRVVAMKVLQLFFGKLLLKYRFELEANDQTQPLIPSQRLVSYLKNKIKLKVTRL